MAFRDYLIGEVAQDRVDGLITRRQALERLARMGVGAAAATSLLASCGDDGDDDASGASTTSTTSATEPVAPTEAVPPESITFDGPHGRLLAASATPSDPKANVLVIHENKGLTPHFPKLVGRLAGSGYAALCVDLLSPEGTAALANPDDAPARLADAPVEDLVADLRAGLDELDRRNPGLPDGAVGFCFGGGMTWSLLAAGEGRLKAAVPFYGPFPQGASLGRASAAVLAIYGSLDTGVNATRDAAEAALQDAGLEHEMRTFEGADHAFFNDTGPRYNAEAAAEAYDALLAWFGQHLR